MMVGVLQLELCVLLLNLSFCCCTTHPHQTPSVRKKQTEAYVILDSKLASTWQEEIFGGGRSKSKAENCSVLETKGTVASQTIIDVSAVTTFRFFIQPLPGFKSLLFRVKLNNKRYKNSWKYPKKKLIINGSRMKITRNHSLWIPVDVAHFKTDINLRSNRHRLRVKIGKDAEGELLTRWRKFYSYEGFTVEGKGALKVLLNCSPRSFVAEHAVDRRELRGTVLLACVVSGCFLLVASATTLYLLIFGRSHTLRNHQNHPPHASTSLVKGRCTKKDETSGNICGSKAENTLAKLKQNFDASRFPVVRDDDERACPGVAEADKAANSDAILSETVQQPCESSGISSGSMRDTLAISLLEEKEALREYLGLNSPVENHYVEMHGIISRSSSLSK